MSFMKDHAQTLAANGYRLIPIHPNTKTPGRWAGGVWSGYSGWQRHCITDTTAADLDVWSLWPGCGVGLACGNVIGIDVDITDAAVAYEVELLTRTMLGDTQAKRVGQHPKCALFYRATEPFKGRTRHPLELRGVGSQMVLLGVHPDTGQPYQWPNGCLTEIDRSALPVYRPRLLGHRIEPYAAAATC